METTISNFHTSFYIPEIHKLAFHLTHVVMGPLRGSLGASFVSADWRVRVLWSSGLVDRPSDLLYVHTITLSRCMDI